MIITCYIKYVAQFLFYRFKGGLGIEFPINFFFFVIVTARDIENSFFIFADNGVYGFYDKMHDWNLIWL